MQSPGAMPQPCQTDAADVHEFSGGRKERSGSSYFLQIVSSYRGQRKRCELKCDDFAANTHPVFLSYVPALTRSSGRQLLAIATPH
jgi:hypothetical protein